MNLKIKSGYLEMEFTNGQKASVSLAYIASSVYFTNWVKSCVAKYYPHCESPFDRPDMAWDPMKNDWVPYYDALAISNGSINNFILQCRRNQNVS